MAKLYETINAENWCKGYFALNRNGQLVGMKSRGAVRWCLGGHLDRIGLWRKKRRIISVEQAIRALYPERAPGGFASIIPEFNDHNDTTLDDVLRVCKLVDV